jgi:AcrR family transcriptional regulator
MFVERGYDAVSMRMIAQRIEYSPTAIYFHFKDKEALFQELCATDFLALAQVFAEVAKIADPIERLRRLGLVYADFAIEHPNHYRLMFMTPRPAVEPTEAQAATRGNPEEDAYALLRQTVAAGIAAGVFRPELSDEEELAQLVWAGVHGVVSLQIAKEQDPWVDWRPARRTAERMIEVMVRGLTAREG